MALPNLSGSNIQDTFQRVLHTDGASIFNGTGSTILSSTELTSLQAIGSSNISSTEWAEIAKIGSADISATEWSYVAQMQDVSGQSSPTFVKVLTTNEEGAAFSNASGRCGIGFVSPSEGESDIDFKFLDVTKQRFNKDGDISGSGELVGLAVKGGTF
jgi:hypothetical protein